MNPLIWALQINAEVQAELRSRFEKPNAPWSLSMDTASVKLAKISLIVVPMGVEPGGGLDARSSIALPPVSVLATNADIDEAPPSLSDRYIMKRNPAP